MCDGGAIFTTRPLVKLVDLEQVQDSLFDGGELVKGDVEAEEDM